MDDVVVRIMMELLSTLALATKELKQGRTIKYVKKVFGEKDFGAVMQRLDRLTQDEARTTAAQTLEVIYGLVKNMSTVMDGEFTWPDTQRVSNILPSRWQGVC